MRKVVSGRLHVSYEDISPSSTYSTYKRAMEGATPFCKVVERRREVPLNDLLATLAGSLFEKTGP